jgi:phosphoglycerate kinase
LWATTQKRFALPKDGEGALLENVRFHKAETKNDPEFSKHRFPGEIYVTTLSAPRTEHILHAASRIICRLCGF